MTLRTVIAAALLAAPLTLIAQAPMQHDAMTPGEHMKPPVPPSKAVTVTFQGKVTVFTVEDLMKLPQVTVHVHNAHRNGVEETYTGPLLANVLAAAGLSGAHENEKTILHSSIVATGTDHYFVLYSAAEVEPAFSTGQVIVAIMKGNMLPDEEGGGIQIINTTDAKPARWVHGLMSINVMSLARAE